MAPNVALLPRVFLDEYETHVPPGKYHLKLLSHETMVCFKTKRLVLTFSICDFGDHCGKQLKRFYNIKEFIGKPGKKGRFYPKRTGDFLIEYYNLFPGRISRLDRVPMEPFYQNILIARISTVTTNNQGKALPEELQYSKVAELLAIEK